MLDTPVVFMIFNRPDTTARVFAEIARAKPRQLLVVADGPRPDRPGEKERCEATRAVTERVDWDCEVMRNYSEANLGCKVRIHTGLNWVFEQCAEAIILEDDCLPDPTFFQYCVELLARYRKDERISMISGDNFLFGEGKPKDSYFFSRYTEIWGWATWRRAWQPYDVEIRHWPAFRDAGRLRGLLPNHKAVRYWTDIFDRTYAGEIDTWDYQWTFANWYRDTYAIHPSVNMISNIGFGEEATHTRWEGFRLAAIPNLPMEFPLRHPRQFVCNTGLDRLTEYNKYSGRSPVPLWRRVVGRIRRSFTS